jgi:5-methylcytosine-specific restriction endonuclease McrA
MPLEERDGVMGKVCSQCKEWKPVAEYTPRLDRDIGVQSACRVCQRPRHNKYAEEHREIRQEYSRQYYADNTDYFREYTLEHKDKLHAYGREYRQANAERIHVRVRGWQKGNPDKLRVYKSRHRRSHLEEVRAQQRRWTRSNPEKVQASRHRRRSRERGNGGSFTAREWEQLKARYGNVCLRCGRGEPEVQLTPDHVVALAAGGSNYIDNIQPLCRSCNSSKGAKHIDYRREEG